MRPRNRANRSENNFYQYMADFVLQAEKGQYEQAKLMYECIFYEEDMKKWQEWDDWR